MQKIWIIVLMICTNLLGNRKIYAQIQVERSRLFPPQNNYDNAKYPSYQPAYYPWQQFRPPDQPYPQPQPPPSLPITPQLIAPQQNSFGESPLNIPPRIFLGKVPGYLSFVYEPPEIYHETFSTSYTIKQNDTEDEEKSGEQQDNVDGAEGNFTIECEKASPAGEGGIDGYDFACKYGPKKKQPSSTVAPSTDKPKPPPSKRVGSPKQQKDVPKTTKKPTTKKPTPKPTTKPAPKTTPKPKPKPTTAKAAAKQRKIVPKKKVTSVTKLTVKQPTKRVTAKAPAKKDPRRRRKKKPKKKVAARIEDDDEEVETSDEESQDRKKRNARLVGDRSYRASDTDVLVDNAWYDFVQLKPHRNEEDVAERVHPPPVDYSKTVYLKCAPFEPSKSIGSNFRSGGYDVACNYVHPNAFGPNLRSLPNIQNPVKYRSGDYALKTQFRNVPSKSSSGQDRISSAKQPTEEFIQKSTTEATKELNKEPIENRSGTSTKKPCTTSRSTEHDHQPQQKFIIESAESVIQLRFVNENTIRILNKHGESG